MVRGFGYCFCLLAFVPSAAAQLSSDPVQSVGVQPDLLKQVGIDQKLEWANSAGFEVSR